MEDEEEKYKMEEVQVEKMGGDRLEDGDEKDARK